MTFLNLVFDAKRPQTSPVSYPHLWGASDLPRFHWDDNTNSLMERNLGQAIGLGAVFDPVHKDSTVLPWAIHDLEALMKKMRPPAWPFDPPDAALVGRGKGVYEKLCARCHDDRPKGGDAGARENVGTDRARIDNFDIHIQGKPAIEAIGEFLGEIKKKSYVRFDVRTAADIAELEGRRVPDFQGAGVYTARSLAGVWATAPYLHNNSVPSLAALLELDLDCKEPGKPARPSHFSVKGKQYDVRAVGLEIDPEGTEFDTTKEGNHNIGHTGAAYGTALECPDKRALLEYLKTL